MPRDLLTPACREVRASVGPVAWVVLEELVMSAEDSPRSIEVATTVRDLAAVIGLSKDTIASGLRRLVHHGLVTREDQRDRRSGCFGTRSTG
jgi:DNA-binding MarR family transcriptional regulator